MCVNVCMCVFYVLGILGCVRVLSRMLLDFGQSFVGESRQGMTRHSKTHIHVIHTRDI